MEKNMMVRLAAMLMVVAMVFAFTTQTAFASGTEAGTTITNTASVTYNDGANVRAKSATPVTLTVRQVIRGAFVGGNTGSSNGLDHRTIVFPFTFENTGNQGDAYSISTGALPGNFTNLKVYYDKDSSGTVTGADSLLNTGANTWGWVASDKFLHLLFQVDAANETDNSANAFSATFTSLSNTSGSFLTKGAVVPINVGTTFTYTWTYTVAKPVLNSSIVQTTSGTIPGSSVSFAVTYQNIGHAAVNGNATIAYTLPSELKYLGPIGTANGVTAVYTPATTYGGSLAITIPNANLGALASSFTFTVPCVIEQDATNGTGTTTGTDITSAATNFQVTYQDNNATPHVYGPSTPNGTNTGFVTTTVTTAKGAKWTVVPANQSAAAGEWVEYVLTVKNMGNSPMNATNVLSFADALNGGLDVAHTFARGSYGASSTSYNDSTISAGDTKNVFVRVQVPGGATIAQTIGRQLTASVSGAGVTYTGYVATDNVQTITTTVAATKFSFVLSAIAVSGTTNTDINNPIPGDVVEFQLQINNTGGATATSVLISLPIPSNMTYQLNGYAASKGLTVNGVNTNNTGGPVAFDLGSPGNITTTAAFSVPVGITTITYKCAVN